MVLKACIIGVWHCYTFSTCFIWVCPSPLVARGLTAEAHRHLPSVWNSVRVDRKWQHIRSSTICFLSFGAPRQHALFTVALQVSVLLCCMLQEAEAKVAEQAEIERLEALAKSEAEAGRRRAEGERGKANCGRNGDVHMHVHF